MSDQRISQAEIDALLHKVSAVSEPVPDPGLSADDLLLAREALGVYVSRAVPALSNMAGAECDGGVADVNSVLLREVSNLGAPQVLVGRVELSGGLRGPVYFVFPLPFAKMVIAQLQKSAEPDEGALLRTLVDGLTVMNESGLPPLSEYLDRGIRADTVKATEATALAEVATEPPDAQMLAVGVDMAVGDAMGRMLMVLSEGSARAMVSAARTKQPAKPVSRPAPEVVTAPPAIAPEVVPLEPIALAQPAVPAPPEAPAQPAPPAPAAEPFEPSPAYAAVAAALQASAAPVVQPMKFPSLSQVARPEPRTMELLMDVKLKVTVEIGRTRRHVKDVLSLGPGYVLELDRLANEQVDVLVNGKLVAKAEVVVVDENYGARITEIVSPENRVQAMG